VEYIAKLAQSTAIIQQKIAIEKPSSPLIIMLIAEITTAIEEIMQAIP